MRGAAAIAALALVMGTSAAAAEQTRSPAGASHLTDETTLLLSPGERVTVRLGPDGRLTLVSVVPEDAAHALPPRPGVPKPPGVGNPLVETPEGTVSFLTGAMGDGAVLKVENGTSKAFDYQVVLLMGTDAAPVREPTGVCTVLPLLSGYETWPRRRVNAILLNHFTPRDTNQVVCQEPRKAPAAAPRIAGGTPTNN
jgi:hypothetical protein